MRHSKHLSQNIITELSKLLNIGPNPDKTQTCFFYPKRNEEFKFNKKKKFPVLSRSDFRHI